MKAISHFWHIYLAKAIYALLAYICRKNNLRTPSGKFLRMKFCPPESFAFFVSLPGTLVKALVMLCCYIDRWARRSHVFCERSLFVPTTPFCAHPTHNLAIHLIVHDLSFNMLFEFTQFSLDLLCFFRSTLPDNLREKNRYFFPFWYSEKPPT